MLPQLRRFFLARDAFKKVADAIADMTKRHKPQALRP